MGAQSPADSPEADDAASTIPTTIRIPEIVGQWWQIAPDEPDISPYTWNRTLNSSAVDFTVFQAADRSWRLVSCVRNIKETKGRRLLHQWKTDDLSKSNWTPVGILGHSATIGAAAANPDANNSVRAPHMVRQGGKYYLFFDSGGARALISNDGIDWKRHTAADGSYKFFSMGRDMNLSFVKGRWQAVFLNNPDKVHPGRAYMAGRTAPKLEGPWSDPPVVVRSEGNPESPFLLEHDGVYYLWQQSRVFASTDPLNFRNRQPITKMWQWKYAPEVFEHDRQWYAAAYNRGIWLAKMKWSDPVAYRTAPADEQR